jgi:hypothetical protein
MRVPRLRLAALALVSGIALSGCAYDMYGDGYGYGGGYGGLGVGIGYGGGYGGYGYGYSPYGYGYGGYGYGGYYDPFGWYGGYYYPGTGIYVYDRDRHRRVMTDEDRRHWREVFQRAHGSQTTTATARVAPSENWSGFNRRQRGWDSTNVSNGSSRGHWSRDNSSTTRSTEGTTTTRSNDGWRGRGHRHDD